MLSINHQELQMQRNRAYLFLVLVVGSLAFSACGQGPETVTEYESWMKDPEHGLCQTRTVNDLRITMQYLPPELLMYREQLDGEDMSSSDPEKGQNLYKSNLMFLMTIAPIDPGMQGQDVMMHGLASEQEFFERQATMNFDMSQHLSLRTAYGEAQPVLAHFENSYGLKKERRVMLAFTSQINEKQVLDTDTLDVSFVDKMFDTGIHHFIFETKSLKAASEVFPSDPR